MSEESTMLLRAIWIWADAAAAFTILGILLPVAAGFAIGVTPLAAHRNDWRPLRQLGFVLAAFLASGCSALLLIEPPAPERAFWIALSLQTGVLILVAAAAVTLRISFRRRREEQEALAALSAPRAAGFEHHESSTEPGARSRLTGIDAEYWIAEWMRHLGAVEAVVTPSRRDGGVDVRSDHYVAQVKHRPGDFVSVDLVRALAGVAGVENRVPLFFSSSHYSRDAIAFANTVGMPLFIFRPGEGRLVGANATAAALRSRGFLGRKNEPDGAAVRPRSTVDA